MMYGLFFYTCDYYEWEELRCVSRDIKALEAEAVDFPLYDKEGHKKCWEEHYMIKEVTVV